VTKPLRPLELIARMKALVRRDSIMNDLDVECGDMHFGTSYRNSTGRQADSPHIHRGAYFVQSDEECREVVAYAVCQAIWGNTPGVEDT
jgi:DNA-binding response OmpR family regulator